MITKERQKDISIIVTFMIAFIVLLLAAVCGINYLVFSNWYGSIQETAAELAEKMDRDITLKIDTFMQSPVNMNEINSKLYQTGVIHFSDEKVREKFFASVLSSYSENIYSYGFGTENGEYFGALRNKSGERQSVRRTGKTGGSTRYYSIGEDMANGDFLRSESGIDPRETAWYQAAKELRAPVFSPVYRCSLMKDLAISAAQPVYNSHDELQGVFNARILLADMSDELAGIVENYQGYIFIVEKDTGYLIANSLEAANYALSSDGVLERKTYKSLGNETLERAYRQYQDTGKSDLFANDQSGGLFVHFQEYRLSGVNWLIVSAIPERQLTGALMHNIRNTVVLVCAAALFSVLMYSIISRKLFRPIKGLLCAAEKFALGDLSQRASVERKDEIGRISEAFNMVADSLQLHVNELESKIAARTDELQKAYLALEERQNQLHLILNSTAEGIFGTDMEGICTFCNESCLQLLGYDRPEEILGKEMRGLIYQKFRDGTPHARTERPLSDYLTAGLAGRAAEELLWRADGTCFDAEFRALPQLKDGTQDGFVVTFTDITERKVEAKQIEFLNCHDTMTGLKNRRCFEHNMELLDKEENLPISVIFIDLNGLKMINDTFGHRSGDELIVKAAEVLKQNCRKRDIAARIGGDEFAVLLPETALEDAKLIASRLKSEFSNQKIRVIPCSMAIGICTKTRRYQRIEHTLELAENEMYKEKNISKQRFGAEAVESIIHALHEKSAWEKRHSEEVGRLCGEIGMVMNLPQTEIRKLNHAGYLHDIGKIALSENLIKKNPLTLSEAEQELIKQHPAIGYRILNLSEELLDLADGVYGHHERWDGQGYPKGLKGEEIPLISRIIAVAEAYEQTLDGKTMTQESKSQALHAIMEGSGTQFDPNLTELLNRMKGGSECRQHLAKD